MRGVSGVDQESFTSVLLGLLFYLLGLNGGLNHQIVRFNDIR